MLAIRTRRILLIVFAVLFGTAVVLFRTMPRRGSVQNHSSQALWVVETDSGRAVAHRLAPGWTSPPWIDADGVRSEQGIAEAESDPHRSWWKVRDVSVALVQDHDATLEISCWFCSKVHDLEFGPVRYDDRPGWGEPLHR